MRRLLQLLVRGYRLAISPLFPPRCRFLPTCSDYALQALERHGALAGGWLALRRFARCHPFNPGGIDEVPHWECRRECRRECRAPARTSLCSTSLSSPTDSSPTVDPCRPSE